MCIFVALVAVLFAAIYYGKIKNKNRTTKTDHYVLVYGFMYYWIVCSAIEQRSVNYLSADAIVIIIFTILLYQFLCKEKPIQNVKS